MLDTSVISWFNMIFNDERKFQCRHHDTMRARVPGPWNRTKPTRPFITGSAAQPASRASSRGIDGVVVLSLCLPLHRSNDVPLRQAKDGAGGGQENGGCSGQAKSCGGGGQAKRSRSTSSSPTAETPPLVAHPQIESSPPPLTGPMVAWMWM